MGPCRSRYADSVSNACARRPHTCLTTSAPAATTTPGHQHPLRARADPTGPRLIALARGSPIFEPIVVMGMLGLAQPGSDAGSPRRRAALGRHRKRGRAHRLACRVGLGARCAPLRGRGARRSSRSRRRARSGDDAGAARAAPPRSAAAAVPLRLAPRDGRRVKARMARSRRQAGWVSPCRTQRQRARPLLPPDPLIEAERRGG